MHGFIWEDGYAWICTGGWVHMGTYSRVGTHGYVREGEHVWEGGYVSMVCFSRLYQCGGKKSAPHFSIYHVILPHASFFSNPPPPSSHYVSVGYYCSCFSSFLFKLGGGGMKDAGASWPFAPLYPILHSSLLTPPPVVVGGV